MNDSSQANEKLVLCPYCGHAQYGGDRCEACAGLFEPLSRRATQLAMGPWQIRDKHNPFRPGCCYDVLKKMAAAGKIKSTTVMRGPTTRQFWSIARNVPGVAHLIGYCHACGTRVQAGVPACPSCDAPFIEPRERNALGLIFKDDNEARRGQEALDAELRGEPALQRTVPGPTKRTPPRPAQPGDLLAEVLDLSGDIAPASPVTSSPPAASSASLLVSPASLSPRPASPLTAAQSPVAKPIDFGPPASNPKPAPASAFDVEPTRELPEGRGISTTGLLMIALNIIAIATIVVLYIMLR